MIEIIYLIGCVFALFIVIHEFLKMENNVNTDYDDTDEQDKQYGLSAVVILLSWISVILWVWGYIDYKINKKD